MPTLPSKSRITIEPDGRGAASLRPLVLRRTSSVGGVDTYEFTDTGVADLELADITGTGVYVPIVAGTYPSAPRIVARRLGGAHVLVY
jgi:hypothetical protein